MSRSFGPCPKCGGTALVVQFHEGKMVKPFGLGAGLTGFAPSCRYSKATCGEDGHRGEHLEVHCRRCQFGWIEPTNTRAIAAELVQSERRTVVADGSVGMRRGE